MTAEQYEERIRRLLGQLDALARTALGEVTVRAMARQAIDSDRYLAAQFRQQKS